MENTRLKITNVVLGIGVFAMIAMIWYFFDNQEQSNQRHKEETIKKTLEAGIKSSESVKYGGEALKRYEILLDTATLYQVHLQPNILNNILLGHIEALNKRNPERIKAYLIGDKHILYCVNCYKSKKGELDTKYETILTKYKNHTIFFRRFKKDEDHMRIMNEINEYVKKFLE